MKRIEEFTRYLRAVQLPNTVRKYTASAEQFLNWLNDNGFSELGAAPRDAFSNYILELTEEGYLTATLNLQIASVNRYLKWCRLKEIPTPDFHPPETPKQNRIVVRDILTPKTMSQYFELADELREPTRTAVMLLPCMGLRVSEMVSLPLKCFQRVPLQLKDNTRKEVLTAVVKGKGGNERFVPLLNEGEPLVMDYIEGWRSQHPDIKWFFPGSKRKTRGARRHISERALHDAIQRIRRPLGRKFTPHTMRRTYLTFLYRRGVEPVALAKIAGHKDVKTLMNFYLYLDEVDLSSAVHEAGGKLTGEE